MNGNGLKVGPSDGNKSPQSDYFEDEPVNLTAGIAIKGLTKKFKVKGKEKVCEHRD